MKLRPASLGIVLMTGACAGAFAATSGADTDVSGRTAPLRSAAGVAGAARVDNPHLPPAGSARAARTVLPPPNSLIAPRARKPRVLSNAARTAPARIGGPTAH